jgi:hypothetical protein
MRARTLLAAAVLGAAGAVLPATPAAACITLYVPVIGSVCASCQFVEKHTGVPCP